MIEIDLGQWLNNSNLIEFDNIRNEVDYKLSL